MSIIKWAATKEEKAIIKLIAKRALKDEQHVRAVRAERIETDAALGIKFDNTPLTEEQQRDFIDDTRMDIEATHCNGCPLDLERLLNFDDFNFRHDIVGIYNNLDRDTGKLGNHFLPRCRRK